MDMIERVALALYHREQAAALKEFPEFASADGQWDALIGERGKQMWRDTARAAIEAMREPTDEMRIAVENDAVIQSGLDDCNQHDIPENAWRLMIDAALKS